MNNRQSKNRIKRRAFTLIEILIVVTILGILAGVTIPQFADAGDDAAKAAFITSGRKFVEAAALYRTHNRQFLEGSKCGKLPSGFEDYVRPEQWVGGTPIGGLWDVELNKHGVTSAIGVHFHGGGAKPDAAFMAQIDAVVDDGDLTTGGFRKFDGDRYYFIVAD